MEPSLDTSPCLYFRFSDAGVLLAVNDVFCAAMEYEKPALAGAKIDEMLTLPTRIFFQTHFLPLLQLQGQATEIFISLLTRTKNQIPLLLNAHRKTGQSGTYIECAGILVPNRKKFEEELILARKKVEDALNENTTLVKVQQELQQHTKQLDESLAALKRQHREQMEVNKAVSHDLQEPIRKLLYFTDQLSERKEQLSDKESIIIAKLQRVGEQMSAVVSGLQQFLWLTEAKPQIVSADLQLLVQEAAEKLRKERPDNWELKAEALPVIPGDLEQLKRLFYYLMDNAIKYKRQDGMPVIQVKSAEVEQNQFRTMEGQYHYKKYLRLQISDNGTGFDPIHREQVFGLFTRLHHGPGQGLGLALAKKIVEHHHGWITADSRPREGTTINVFLPMQQEEPTP